MSGKHRDLEYRREIEKLKRKVKKGERKYADLMEKYKKKAAECELEKLAECTRFHMYEVYYYTYDNIYIYILDIRFHMYVYIKMLPLEIRMYIHPPNNMDVILISVVQTLPGNPRPRCT